MEKLWKDISGFEGLYKISNLGDVKSLYKNKILKPRAKENGYLIVSLYKNKKDTKYYIHRLVATEFIENKDNKEFVNHKDFNKSNNCVENLEWVSRTENFRHYRYSKKWDKTFRDRDKKLVSKTLQRVKDNKKEILRLYKENKSIKEISEKLNLGRDFVTDVLYLFDFI